jgi:hypothetical protein
MAYTISNTDGSTLVLLADGTVDDYTTSLVLIGKNYSGFGEYYNNNLIKLLANNANTVDNSPNNPLKGQLWYDTTAKRLKVYDGAFKSLANIVAFSSTSTGLLSGDFWWDTVNQQLKLYNNGSSRVIGPQFGNIENGWISPPIQIKDIHNDAKNLTLIKNYGVTLGYISSESFFIQSTSTYAYLNTGTTTSTVKGLTILGDIQLSGNLYLGNNPPPHSNSTGTVGQFAYGSNYLYVCTATNAWSRIRMTDAGPW